MEPCSQPVCEGGGVWWGLEPEVRRPPAKVVGEQQELDLDLDLDSCF